MFYSDDATLIMVNLFIRSFAKIDDVKMEYSVQITFRQKWSDDRLIYKHKLGHGDMQSIYTTCCRLILCILYYQVV